MGKIERDYSFAGVCFRVCGSEAELFADENMLAPFREDGAEPDCVCHFRLADRLPLPVGTCIFQSASMAVYRTADASIRYQGPLGEQADGAYLRICRREDRTEVLLLREYVPERIPSKMVLNALEAEHWIAKHDGFLLHCAFVCHENRGILFTAPSGTGKSTQAELWHRLRGAEQINGDRAAVTVGEQGVMAWGVPFAGSSGICRNFHGPLTAIVYLSQAPETAITRLTGLRAFRSVWEGCSINVWDREDVDRCSRTVMQVVESVPVFHLACTPDESAVIALEKALEQMR